jgi:AcrR family transcriptional regulator
MPPRGPLSVDRLVDVAAEIADREGLEAVTLARIATDVGVKTPSLYNHVDGLAGLHRALSLRAIQELGERLQRAAVGLARDDAVHAVATAYRDFARERPGLYATTLPSSEHAAPELRDAGHRVVETVVSVLAGYGLEGDEAIHATRALRSVLHGFTSLELAGGFGLDVSVEATFEWILDRLTAGFAGAHVTS